MSKELIAQKNFLFKGRVLGLGERFSTSVLHARDLVAGKLAVESVGEAKPTSNATASENALAAAVAPVAGRGEQELNIAANEHSSENCAGATTQAVGTETSTGSDDASQPGTVVHGSGSESNVGDVTQDAEAEASTGSDDHTPADEDFDQMTMPQLKEVLTEIGVPFAARASKADLLELVKESFGEDFDATENKDSSAH